MDIENSLEKPGPGLTKKIFVIGTLGLLAVPAITAALRRRASRRRQVRHNDSEARVDKMSKDSFPASDPPSPHFVDIPVNRQ